MIHTPKFHLFIAGVKTPMIAFQVHSGFNTLARCDVSIPYSPWIINLRRYTKFQIWRQDTESSPSELEFDGALVAKSESKDVNGSVQFNFTGYTDGIIWSQRKQLDAYITQLEMLDNRGMDTSLNIRIDGVLTNYFSQIVKQNSYDVGMATACVLTNEPYGKKSDGITGYRYFYNGKGFICSRDGAKPLLEQTERANPWWYRKFLTNYGLNRKLYGVPTNEFTKKFLNTQETFDIIGETALNCGDLQGLNSYLDIAFRVLSYGYYDIYNIPRATFLPMTLGASKDYESSSKGSATADILALNNRKYPGMAEFFVKPKSIIAIPPKCNILFPDQVVSMSMSYNYLSEPTRDRYKVRIPFVDAPFTTTVVVGPKFDDPDGHFRSFSAPKSEHMLWRTDRGYSPYEHEYGASHFDVQFNTAYQQSLDSLESSMRASFPEYIAAQKRLETLKEKKDAKKEDIAKAEAEVKKFSTSEDFEKTQKQLSTLKNLLNYEFLQSYFKNRSISVQVTSTVDIVPGHSVLIISDSGPHIMAWCESCSKSWSAQGSYSIVLQLSYPRYCHEDITNTALAHDPILGSPTGQAKTSLDYSMALIGSEPIMAVGDFKKPTKQAEEIAKIYKSRFKEDYRKNTKRKIASFEDFAIFHSCVGPNPPDAYNIMKISDYSGIRIANELYVDLSRDEKGRRLDTEPIKNLMRLMDSSAGERMLSTSIVDAAKDQTLNNSWIIKEHNKVISSAQSL